jgi:hypothetical protein
MDATDRMLAFDDQVRFRAPADAVRMAVAGSISALFAVGLLLLMRRVVGAVTADLPALHLFTTAIVAGVVVFGGRVVWRRWALSRPSAVSSGPNGERRDVGIERVIGWAGSAGIVLLALGCSLGRAGDWLLWLPLVGVDQWQLQWFLRSQGTATTGRGFMGAATVDDEAIAGNELQRLVRVRDADGGEAIHGTLRAEFVAGQRQATLHVGFCPPLEHTPAVEVETGDGPDAEVKVAQAFAHGARLEVRLASVAEEDCWVIVELSAKAASADGIGRG